MSNSRPSAIITPTIDPWLVGGFSIVVLAGFIALSSTIPSEIIFGNFVILTVLLNGSHFMASYALLYSSRAYIQRYRMAAVYLPIGLLLCGGVSLWLASGPRANGVGIQALTVATALYLALHYTGQAWGMIASYAYLNGIKFTGLERRVLRGCLRVMAGWHMVWVLNTSPAYIPTALKSVAPHLMQGFNALGILSCAVGIATLFSVRSHNHKNLPAALALPFLSLYVWYLFLSIFPQSIFWVQIFHALQYLPFPMRVELNRASRAEGITYSSPQLKRLFRYSLGLCAAGLFVFVGIDKMLNYPNGGFEAYILVLMSLINIHHYFIDGCVWHISNPEVKAELFAHLKPREA